MLKQELDTPCLVIEKSTLLHNLEEMQHHALRHSIQVRPHVKTHKCSRLAKLQLEYGAIGLSVAKVSEAEVLVNQGLKTILITSPVVTAAKIARLAACLKKTPDILVVVDNEQNLADLNAAGQGINTPINVLVDVDSGLGRTGVRPDYAVNFALKLSKYPWLNLVGIQCYAGHLQHISSYEERKTKSLQVMQKASDIRKAFRSQDLPCHILTGSGTGTYDIDVEVTEITEIQPGSYAVMDVEYSVIESQGNASTPVFQPAMTLLTTVISSNRMEHVTVDAGTKAIYANAHHKPKIISHEGLEYDWGGFGDEHGKITAVGNTPLPANGDVLELVIPHCDPTINLFDQFYLIDNGRVVDVWDIDLRGKSQ
ncbi:DSD1 family PLP-dependent enzyme [Legionella taurinensis]|uniref:DSD1 family PLP-dependent enzyme n=1 Tax=Legionella taurinensis TaxID=70611 RepID=A0A3A5LKW6_9GAMM|nr:DSD1 family PLP-dependent enzyme [Legionella taurinensis]RJT49116.1 DSD1 family PLP-dependent enzyme [Legionella taurinensis]RJT67376.1 DSD1 family PLP-dependent enzyme [Legionella taurinensis]STY26997.1 alanine racemase [Legionella taurinensis]